MRHVRIMIGVGVVVLALTALASPAFAKEKLIFGNFEASVTGQNLETSPARLGVYKEGGIEITGLNLGGTTFGPLYKEDVKNEKGEVIHKRGQINLEVPPCQKFKVSGEVNKEKFTELTFDLKFMRCSTSVEEVGGSGATEEHLSNFTLPITLKATNYSAGIANSALIIDKTVKLGLKKCPVEIPPQTIPGKENPEKLYEEIVEISNEGEEPERWEHSKKLKELYPSGEKELLDIEFAEKFKSIVSYRPNAGVCGSRKGEENGKIVTEVGNPHYGQIEYTNGHLFGEIDEMEIRNGNLKFTEPTT